MTTPEQTLPKTIRSAGKSVDSMMVSAKRHGIQINIVRLPDLTNEPFEELKHHIGTSEKVDVIMDARAVAYVHQLCDINKLHLKGVPWMFTFYSDRIIPLGESWPECESVEWWDKFLTDHAVEYIGG